MKRLILVLSILLFPLSGRAAIGTYIPQTYSRTFVVDGLNIKTIYNRLRVSKTLDSRKDLFHYTLPLKDYEVEDKELLQNPVIRFDPLIEVDGVKYQMSTMMELHIDIVDGQYTVTLKDILVRTESAWAACNYEELSQEGLDDRGRGGRFSRKKLLKIYKVFRPLLEEEFNRYCEMFEKAVWTPTEEESKWIR